MKRRTLEPEVLPLSPEDFLCEGLLSLRDVSEMRAFLRDLLTPAELEAMVDRWRVVPLLLAGVAYREIHDRTAVSVTTIGRVARFLGSPDHGYACAAERLQARGRWPLATTENTRRIAPGRKEAS